MSLNKTRRLGVFILRISKTPLEDHDFFLLRDISENLTKLSIVCLNTLDDADKKRLEEFSDTILSPQTPVSTSSEWQQTLLDYYDGANIESYDELVLFDDSFLGPFYPFQKVFAVMEEKDVDFWGLTEYPMIPDAESPSLDRTRSWYLDRSFLVIRNRMARSAAFRDCWGTTPVLIQADTPDDEASRQFTQQFTQLGYRAAAYCDTRAQDVGDPTEGSSRPHFQLYDLIANHAYPIMKKSVFAISKDEMLAHHYSDDVNKSLALIQKKYDFDTGLIYRFLLRNFNLEDITDRLNLGFVLPCDLPPTAKKGVPAGRIAVIAHLYHSDLFASCQAYLDGLPEYVDLIITTNTRYKADVLETIFRERFGRRLSILVTKGRGRDLAALLVACRDIVKKYDYFCFIHDEKADQDESQEQGEAARELLWDSMLGSTAYIEHIITTFEENPSVGLLVAPLPFAGKDFATQLDAWDSFFDDTRDVLEKLGVGANLSLDPTKGPHSVDSSFWCRFDALAPLFENGDWQYEDFPEEPILVDEPLRHALKRCLPYVAQAQGYLTATVTTTRFATTEIDDLRYLLRETIHAVRGLSATDYEDFSDFRNALEQLRGVSTRTRGSGVASSQAAPSRTASSQAAPSQAAPSTKTTRPSAKSTGPRSPQETNRLLSTLQRRLNQIRTRLLHAKHIRAIQSSPFFDQDWYVKQEPEARSWPGGPAAHYMAVGWKQDRDPSPSFSNAHYLEMNEDVASGLQCPLLHYELHGRAEGRRGAGIPEGKYRALRIRRTVKRLAGRLVCAPRIQKNKQARLLVFLHLFYEKSWVEIREYLKNLGPYNYDLIVTYCEEYLSPEARESVRAFKPDVRLVCCENTGTDVRHFHTLLKTIDLDDYDIVFKLHSKGTKRDLIFIYRQLFKLRDWFLYLYEGILGATAVHKTIATLTGENKIGMVAAENLLVEDPPHKKELVHTYMRAWGVPIPEEYCFVAGTCFAVRANLLKPLQTLDVDLDVAISGVFSPDHALERIYCLSILNAGYRFGGNQVMTRTYRRRNRHSDYLYAHSTEQLYNDKRFVIDAEFFYMGLDNRFMESYELIELPLRDLRRSYPKDIKDNLGYSSTRVEITETAPYQYLCGNREDYRAYCAYHQESRRPFMSEARFNELMENMRLQGFNAQQPIIVNAKNVIMDGQHRACYLHYTQGSETTVPVLRIKIASAVRMIREAERMASDPASQLSRSHHDSA